MTIYLDKVNDLTVLGKIRLNKNLAHIEKMYFLTTDVPIGLK